MARSKNNKPKKSNAGMRLDKHGVQRYAARDAKGRFIKRNTTDRVYYTQDGKLVKAGIGVARANSDTGRKSQAKGGTTIQDSQVPQSQARVMTQEEVDRLRLSGVEVDEEGRVISYYGQDPKNIVEDIYEEPVLHETFSGGDTETLRYDNTNMGRWREKAKEYTDVEKERSTDTKFVYDPAAQAKWGIDYKGQEYAYKLFKEANQVVDEIRQLTDAEMHEDVIAARFSYNLNVKPEILGRRIDAALEIVEKGARQYVIDVAAKYRQDFKSNFENQFEAEDIKEFMEALEELNDRQFLSVLKYASKSNLAYVIQSVIDEYGYEFALGEIRALTQNFREYKTNKAFREDVKWKNWRKSD